MTLDARHFQIRDEFATRNGEEAAEAAEPGPSVERFLTPFSVAEPAQPCVGRGRLVVLPNGADPSAPSYIRVLSRRCASAGPDRREAASAHRAHDDRRTRASWAAGITAYLKNGGTLKRAAVIANHASTRITQLYDRRSDEVNLDEIERILI